MGKSQKPFRRRHERDAAIHRRDAKPVLSKIKKDVKKTVDGGVSRFANKPLIHQAIIKEITIIYRADLLVTSCISHRVIPDLSVMLATQGRFAFKRWQNTWSNAISPSQQSYGAYHVFAAQAVEPV
jgi:hypothetical protein